MSSPKLEAYQRTGIKQRVSEVTRAVEDQGTRERRGERKREGARPFPAGKGEGNAREREREAQEGGRGNAREPS